MRCLTVRCCAPTAAAAAPLAPPTTSANDTAAATAAANTVANTAAAAVDTTAYRVGGVLGHHCLCLAAGVLTSLPPQLSRLENLTTLIVSSNALRELPDAVATLKKLKNFEAAFNQLSTIPEGFAQLESLQAHRSGIRPATTPAAAAPAVGRPQPSCCLGPAEPIHRHTTAVAPCRRASQVIDLSNNHITSLAPLSALKELVSLKVPRSYEAATLS